jgi:osmoprotectant transport system permease protein
MGDDPVFRWSWITGNSDEILQQLWEHVQLTGIAIIVGLAISLPIAIYAHRNRRVLPPLIGFTGILYTIPSVALFAFLQAYTGLSFWTAEIGLVSYTLLILIRNIVAGLNGVPADVKEAAVGMGYSGRQLLFRVELPLALPVIVAGIRIATVTIIGLVTVTALIGLGGFGHFILSGFRSFSSDASTMMLAGGLFSVALAVMADVALIGTEKLLAPWARKGVGRSVAT